MSRSVIAGLVSLLYAGLCLGLCLGLGLGLSACSPETEDHPSEAVAEGAGAAEETAGGGEAAPRTNRQGYNYVPANPDAYVPAGTIQGWVADFDEAAIEGHAWDLWTALNAPSGQYVTQGDTRVEIPVWETWFDEFELFRFEPTCPDGEDCSDAVPFHAPRQQLGAAQVLSFNKFSAEFMDWVGKEKLYDETTLIALNAKFQENDTPLAERFVPTRDLDPKATMLKPSFWVVKPGQPSPMQYWKGPGMTVDGTLDPNVPTPPTWTQIVVVDPTGTAEPGTPYTLEVKSATGVEKMTFTDYEIVGLDRFYWIPLTADDVEFLKGGNVFIVNGVPVEEMEPGDLALLMAMHVTTAEFGPWTWQSFWWSPDPAVKAPSSVPAPYDNYDLTQAYYMLGSNGEPWIAMNPFLEPPDEGPIFMNPTQLGVHSNCMSCHHAAAYPTLNMESNPATMLLGSYVATGDVQGTEQYFQDRVKTRFMWSMVDFNQQQGKR